MANKNKWLSQEQKVGLVLLSAFVLLAVTLGLIQMRNTIYKPFALSKSIPSQISKQVNTVDALRYRDTDGDGLSDYDELYIYGTSPYLVDTDSDGISDYDEVMSGTNPLCSEGKDCSIDLTFGDSDVFLNTPNQLDSFNFDLNEFLVESLKDPDNVRNLLVESGLDMETVLTLSDEELLQISEELLLEELLADQTDNFNTDLNQDPNQYLAELSKDPNNIRALLLEAGLAKELVDQLSDAELKQISQEVLLNNNFLKTDDSESSSPEDVAEFINQLLIEN